MGDGDLRSVGEVVIKHSQPVTSLVSITGKKVIMTTLRRREEWKVSPSGNKTHHHYKSAAKDRERS